MDKEIYKNGKLVGYLSSNGEIFEIHGGFSNKIGKISFSMKNKVYNSSGKQIAYFEYSHGSYNAFIDDDTKIKIQSINRNRTILEFGCEIEVKEGNTEESLGVAILLSNFETQTIKQKHISVSNATSHKTSHATMSTSSTSTRTQTSKAYTGWIIIGIVIVFIIGALFNQINSCTPEGRLLGTYSPSNEFIYEKDSEIQISGTIYIELESKGRYHLYYKMDKPTASKDSFWGNWNENNGLASFDKSYIVMKSDKTIHVTLDTSYYKDGEYRTQNVTYILKKN